MSFSNLPSELRQGIVMELTEPFSLLQTSRQESEIFTDSYFREQWELQHPLISLKSQYFRNLELPRDEAKILRALDRDRSELISSSILNDLVKLAINNRNLNIIKKLIQKDFWIQLMWYIIPSIHDPTANQPIDYDLLNEVIALIPHTPKNNYILATFIPYGGQEYLQILMDQVFLTDILLHPRIGEIKGLDSTFFFNVVGTIHTYLKRINTPQADEYLHFIAERKIPMSRPLPLLMQ